MLVLFSISFQRTPDRPVL